MAGSGAEGSLGSALQDRSSVSAESGTSGTSKGVSSRSLRQTMQDAKQLKTLKPTASRKTKHAPRHAAQVQPEIAQGSKTDQDAGAFPAPHEQMGFRDPLNTHQAASSRIIEPMSTLQRPSGLQAVSSSSSDSIRPTQRRRSGKAEHPKGDSAQQAQKPAFAGRQISQQQDRRFSQAQAASSSSSEPLQHVLRHRHSIPQASQPHGPMPRVSSPGHADQAEACSGPLLIHANATPAERMLDAHSGPGASTHVEHGSSAQEAEPSHQSLSAPIQEEVLMPEQMAHGGADPGQAPCRRQPRELQGLMPFAWDKCDATMLASCAMCPIHLLCMLAVIGGLHFHDVMLRSMEQGLFKPIAQGCLHLHGQLHVSVVRAADANDNSDKGSCDVPNQVSLPYRPMLRVMLRPVM